MRKATIGIGGVLLAGAGIFALSFGSPPSEVVADLAGTKGLIVHEWGTFLGMNGSDGASLDGMYHEEHALPAFVHSRSRDQLRLPFSLTKGETPIIYFYTTIPRPVSVSVGFPSGVWTQWFPQATSVFPSLMANAQAPDRLRGGRIAWQTELIPPSLAQRGAQPPATSGDALWNHARQVDAAYVKTTNGALDPARPEFERFLFYRGLGGARLPLRLDARGQGTLSAESEPTLGEGVRHVFIIRVENGRGVYRYIPALRSGEQMSDIIPPLSDARPLAEFTRAIADDLAARLTESGLYPKEARAMVNTWTSSYFEADGIRALFVLPQSWTDSFIPIAINPEPDTLVRVMVGRLELLTERREQLAETAIRDLGSAESAKRREAYEFLRNQGRYVEPIVRRVMKTTADDQVRNLCGRLLMTDFVTELRAAVHNAANGKRLNTDPLLLRAHLARLLRAIGSDADARAEGEAVLAKLKTYPLAPNQTLADDPNALEIRGAAIEAMGDDRKAAAIYARRIEHQLKVMGTALPPQSVMWLRDWWIGRVYAECVSRASDASAKITELESHLSTNAKADAGTQSARFFLALLLEAQSQGERAQAQWAALTVVPKPQIPQAAAAAPAQTPAQTELGPYSTKAAGL
jgi:hypothetical protein